MYRDASHLWRSFSHNRTKINIQFLKTPLRIHHKTYYFYLSIQVFVYLGILLGSNLVAFVTSLLFEAPMMGLEKVLFRRGENKGKSSWCLNLVSIVQLEIVNKRKIKGRDFWTFRLVLLLVSFIKLNWMLYWNSSWWASHS